MATRLSSIDSSVGWPSAAGANNGKLGQELGIAQKFLVIRRDNIGDLVCTTPMIHALRQHFRDAHIAVLVNSYNAAVLERNPDIDRVHVYTKAKHRAEHQSLARVYWDRAKLMLELRRENYDYAILAGSGLQRNALRTARFAGAQHIIGFVHQKDYRGSIDFPVWQDPKEVVHEVELSNRLLDCFGMEEAPSNPRVFADPARVGSARQIVHASFGRHVKNIVGLHISARKPSQRWPIERFAQLAREIARQGDVGILLFWSPGTETDPRHPGDDEKAEVLTMALRGLPFAALPTRELGELIAGLSLCDRVICSDGGAMHIAAALEKPAVCLFGDSDAVRWHPWGVQHVLLQPPSRNVRDIGVAEVLEGYVSLGQPV
jgi:ADP-heptose:LPS heptosyltransferase